MIGPIHTPRMKAWCIGSVPLKCGIYPDDRVQAEINGGDVNYSTSVYFLEVLDFLIGGVGDGDVNIVICRFSFVYMKSIPRVVLRESDWSGWEGRIFMVSLGVIVDLGGRESAVINGYFIYSCVYITYRR